jgi:tetratricopeptide (TPR) repeat protein
MVDIVAILERAFKAFIFVPCMALVAWWLFGAWLDKTLTFPEAAIGMTLLAGAFVLGVVSIVAGGWGFLGLLGLIYIVLFAFLSWEYIYWRRREQEHLRQEVERYQAAIARDPLNAAAYSFLGQTFLKLRRIDEAVRALEQALKLDPESRQDRYLMQQAREIQQRLASARQARSK